MRILHFTIYLSIYLPTYLPIHPSIYLSIHPSNHLSVHLSVHLSLSLSLSLSVIGNSSLEIAIWILIVTFCVFTTRTLPMGSIWAARLDQAKAPWPSPGRDEGSLAAAAGRWKHGFHGFTVSRVCFKKCLCIIYIYPYGYHQKSSYSKPVTSDFLTMIVQIGLNIVYPEDYYPNL